MHLNKEISKFTVRYLIFFCFWDNTWLWLT